VARGVNGTDGDRAVGYGIGVRFHAIQTAPSWHEVSANRAAIDARFARLAAEGLRPGDFVVLPEMCETGWTSDAEALRRVTGTVDWLASLASRHGVWVQAGFGEVVDDTRVANSVAILAPSGERKALYRKNFLFPSEQHAFVAGDEIVLVDLGEAVVCPLICYDLRFPELWRLAALAGAEVFTVSSAWPEVRHAHWRALLVARAVENQALVVACNRTGTDPTQRYAGGSTAITEVGERAFEADESQCALSHEFSRASLHAWRAKFGALRDARASLLGSIQVRRV
jgi:predicted amidohydrolase